jgi:hypothetical protein
MGFMSIELSDVSSWGKVNLPAIQTIQNTTDIFDKVLTVVSAIIPPQPTFNDPTLAAEMLTYASNDCFRSLAAHIL